MTCFQRLNTCPMCRAPLGRAVEEEDSSDDDDDDDFNGAMAMAAREGHESIVRLMLERGADDYNWAMSRADAT